MFDLREADIKGDDALVRILKHFYLDVRVGDLDTVSYGREALTFETHMLPSPQAFVLMPGREVSRVWRREAKGFSPAEHGSCYGGSSHALVRQPSAPPLCIFFSPLSREEYDVVRSLQYQDLFGSI